MLSGIRLVKFLLLRSPVYIPMLRSFARLPGGRGRQSEGSDDEPCTEREDADESDLERDGDDATSDTESGAEGADMGAEEYVAGATGCLGAEQDSGADRGDEVEKDLLYPRRCRLG